MYDPRRTDGTRSTGRRDQRSRRAAFAVTALVLASACSTGTQASTPTGPSGTTPPTTEAPPVDGGALTVGITVEATGFDPTINLWGGPTALEGGAILEPLAVLDAQGRAQPWLLTGWTPNADFTSWTLQLRSGVTFHDGEPFDAAAVKKNLDDLLSAPLTGVGLTAMFSAVTVTEASTVRVDLKQSWAAFPESFLAGPNSWMKAPKTIGPDGNAGTHPIGTGPFVFSNWTRDTKLELARNTAYWRKGEPHLDKLTFVPIGDDSSRANALRSSDIDLMMTESARDAKELDENYEVFRDWNTVTTLLALNTRETAGKKPNPLHNLHARKALSYATDPQAIAGFAGEGLVVPTSPFAENTPWGDPAVKQSYASFDREKAKAELAEYTKETGAERLEVRLMGPVGTDTQTILQAVSQQWAEVGIVATIEALDFGPYSLRGVTGDFNAVLGSIYSATDPDQNAPFWSKVTTRGDGEISINFTGYATDQIEEALTKGRSSEDVAMRKRAYTSIVTELNANAVNIWLYFAPHTFVASDRVHGLQQLREKPFANFEPKTLWGEVWIAH